MSETFNFLNLLLVIAIGCNLRQFCKMGRYQARVRGGGGGPPYHMKLKSKKKVIRANLKLFHLYFATFLAANIIYSAIF